MTALPAIASLLLLVACASFSKPRISVEAIEVDALDVAGGEAAIVFDVYNPNSFPIDVRRLTYHVTVGGVTAGRGEADSVIHLGARGSERVRLPLDFHWLGVGAAGTQILRKGEVEYRVRGEIDVDTPHGRHRRDYTRKATL